MPELNMPVAAAMTPEPKPVARVATIGLDAGSSTVLRECFTQFGIQTVAVEGDAAERLKTEKFEGVVLRLNDAAERVLQAARTSTSNRRMVVYGICKSMPEALRFSRYGINALFDDPVERQGALKIVRATHLLVLNELRRYVRLPVVVEVSLETPAARLLTTSREISGGGMSLVAKSLMPAGQTVIASFTLPDAAPVTIKAEVAWSRPAEGALGIRFDLSDARRFMVREWIDNYLEFM